MNRTITTPRKIKVNQYYFLEDNVYETAKKRIEYLFDEFEEVVATTSSGKDSTVIVFLALEVARAKGRLPLKVVFIDQEVEWTETIKHMRELKKIPDIELLWYQFPFEQPNSASSSDTTFLAWDPLKKDLWIRPKEPEGTITTNVFGVKHWYDNVIFGTIISKLFPNKKACLLGGVRAEESPARRMGMTEHVCYKGITWGKINFTLHNYQTFYPIYDWSYTDVWKYIFDNKLPYNKMYDYQYQYGIPVTGMRISSLVHEQALKSLFYLPEVDMELYDKLSSRLEGVSSLAKAKNSFLNVSSLPYMFRSWQEYRDYLLDKIILNPNDKENIGMKLRNCDNYLDKTAIPEAVKQSIIPSFYARQINAILTNDKDGTKIHNLRISIMKYRKAYGIKQ